MRPNPVELAENMGKSVSYYSTVNYEIKPVIVNPFVARFSDGHATLCQKCAYQTNYFSYTHTTIYKNVRYKPRNNVIQLDFVNP